MRSPAEIRAQLLRIRDANQLPRTLIAERARVSLTQLYTVFRFEATEDTLRKLDAFLDAKKLHFRDKHSRLLWNIEDIDRELYREYGVGGMYPRSVQKMSTDRQKRYLALREFHAKCYFVQMMYVETGLKFKIPDGQTYWQFKTKCLRRAKAVCPGDGNAHYIPRPRPDSAGERL